jgi:hypothetical protein
MDLNVRAKIFRQREGQGAAGFGRNRRRTSVRSCKRGSRFGLNGCEGLAKSRTDVLRRFRCHRIRPGLSERISRPKMKRFLSRNERSGSYDSALSNGIYMSGCVPSELGARRARRDSNLAQGHSVGPRDRLYRPSVRCGAARHLLLDGRYTRAILFIFWQCHVTNFFGLLSNEGFRIYTVTSI